MAIDFRDYNDPGVYVEISDTPVTNSPGVEPTIVAFIGTSPDSRQVTEYATIPSSGSKTLYEEGVEPSTAVMLGRQGASSYISGTIGVTADTIANSDNIYSKLTRYIPYLPDGTHQIEVAGDAATLAVVNGTYIGQAPTWTISGLAASVTTLGTSVNIATGYSSPSVQVGQLAVQSGSSESAIIVWETGATLTAKYPQAADKLCWIGIDLEANQTYDLTAAGTPSGTLKLSWDGGGAGKETDSMLAANLTAAYVQEALEDIAEIGIGNVVVEAKDPDSLLTSTNPFSVRFVGKFLPKGTTTQKSNIVTSVKALTKTGADYTLASGTTVGAEATIAAGDVLEVGGERMLVLEVGGNAGITVADGEEYLVQRGFQNTAIQTDIDNGKDHVSQKVVYRVDSQGYTGANFRLNADYVVSIHPGTDLDIDTTVDNRLTVATIDDGVTNRVPRFTVGTKVAATLEVTDERYYAPKHYTRDADVYQDFGDPFVKNSNTVNSDVSLAAKLAFANGANEIAIVAVDPNYSNSDTENWKNAYDKLATEPEVNTIVPLIDINSVTGAALADYIQYKMGAEVAEGLLRRSYYAFDTTQGAVALQDYEYTAKAFRDYRISIVAPGFAYVASPTPVEAKIGGYFIAAAVAARQASFPAQEPLTRKEIYGFTGIESIDFGSIIDLQSYGILAVWKDRLGRFRIKHGLTTDMTNSYTREISVVTSRDRLRDLIFTTLDDGELIGSPMTSRTPDIVMSGVTGALEEAKTTGLIYDYGDIQYRINAIEPTAIEVRFAYKPTLPLNYIVVEFTLDTSLGTLDFQSVNQTTI